MLTNFGLNVKMKIKIKGAKKLKKQIGECTAKELFDAENKNKANENFTKVIFMVLSMYEQMKKMIKYEDWNIMNASWEEIKKRIKPEILKTDITV